MADKVAGFQLVDAGSIAASGTKNVAITVNPMTNKLLVQVAAKYAAVAATTGLAYTVKVSVDGSTFTSSNVAGSTVAPAATVFGKYTFEIGIADFATKKDGGTIEAYQLDFTNTDGTNAVTYVVAVAEL